MKLPRIQDLANAADWHIDVSGVAACALLTLLGWFAIARPLLSSRDEHAMRDADIAQAKDQANRLLADTRAMRVQLTNAQTVLAKIGLPLEQASAINQRLAELTALASECGLEMQYMLPGTLSTSQRFAQLPLRVSGTGNFRACAQFLHRMREKFPDTGLRAFELSRSPADPASLTSFSFELQWFVQSTGAAQPEGASAAVETHR